MTGHAYYHDADGGRMSAKYRSFEAAMRVKHPEWAFTADPVFDYHNERTRCAWEGWQAAIADANAAELALLRRLIADDAYAISFQTFGQYRTALLKAIDAQPAATTDGEVERLRALLLTAHNVLTLLAPEVAALGCGAQRVAENVAREVGK